MKERIFRETQDSMRTSVLRFQSPLAGRWRSPGHERVMLEKAELVAQTRWWRRLLCFPDATN